MFLTKVIFFFQIGKKQDSTGLKVPTAPPGLFFRHAGHRYGAYPVFLFVFCAFPCMEIAIITRS